MGSLPQCSLSPARSHGPHTEAKTIFYLNARKKVVQEELKAMLGLGVIEDLYSDWASPIVWLPKQTLGLFFCELQEGECCVEI